MNESSRALSGKVAIVTGASRGIGRAVAQKLGRQGASVMVSYASNTEAAEKVVSTIRAAGAKAQAFERPLDGAKPVQDLFDATLIELKFFATSFRPGPPTPTSITRLRRRRLAKPQSSVRL